MVTAPSPHGQECRDVNYCPSQEGMTGLIEPINSRRTDPRYFLDSPHQGRNLEAATTPNDPDGLELTLLLSPGICLL